MAWGYRLSVVASREAARFEEQHRACAIGHCGGAIAYASSFRYVRGNGRPITVVRPLCAKHAMTFSMKYSLAWPGMFRGLRRLVRDSRVRDSRLNGDYLPSGNFAPRLPPSRWRDSYPASSSLRG